MATREPVFKPGELVADKYRIEGELGIGGMAAVYSAVHVGLDQPLAIKVLLPQYAENEKLVTRFLREAKAAAKISGEHVGRVVDVGTMKSGTPYMALELLHGEDLGSYIEKKGTLPVEEAVDLVLQACDGIARAHAVGIVHRDIKPSNLFLTQRDGEPFVKVIDFGISKITGEDQSLTQTTEIFGSPQYMSPEQIRASRDVDGRTDVWSLGCVLFELIGGTVPFEAASMMMLGSVILNEPPKKLSSLRANVPPALEAVIRRCLTKDVLGRPASVIELAELLQPFAGKSAGLIDSMRRIGPSSAPSLPIPSSVGSVFVRTNPSEPQNGGTLIDATYSTTPPRKGSSKGRLLLGAAIVVGTALIAGAIFLRPTTTPTPNATGAESAPPAAVSSPAPSVSPPPVTAAETASAVPSSAPPARPLAKPIAKPAGKPVAPPVASAPVPAPAAAPPPASSVVRDRHGGD